MSKAPLYPKNTYDVVIVGGGIAGLSAAVWLSRYRRSVLVLSSGYSRNYRSHAIHGYPGYEGANPNVLREKVYKEARGYGVSIVDAWVGRVTKSSHGFTVEAAGALYYARKILFATGVIDEKPDITGLEEFEGVSAWHCPSCDGFEYTGKKVVVLSWGPQMVGYAQEFLNYTSDITVITNGHTPEVSTAELQKLQKSGIPVYQSRVMSLVGKNGQLEHIELSDGTSIKCDGMFYSIKHTPRLELLEQLGCGLRDDRSVKINRKQETTIKGVYAAGDIAPLEELSVVAAAMGAVAASNIYKSL